MLLNDKTHWKVEITSGTSGITLAPGLIVECAVNICERSDTINLVAMKERIDKDQPNNLRTIRRTISSILDNVTIDDLAAIC